jgi:hypothetical protein
MQRKASRMLKYLPHISAKSKQSLLRKMQSMLKENSALKL